jgi:hypothetical protein
MQEPPSELHTLGGFFLSLVADFVLVHGAMLL